MLTSRTDPSSVSSAFGAGADAYCTKDSPVEHVAAAIKAVVDGDTWLDPATGYQRIFQVMTERGNKILSLLHDQTKFFIDFFEFLSTPGQF